MMENVILKGGPYDGLVTRVDATLSELKLHASPEPGLTAKNASAAAMIWGGTNIYKRSGHRLVDGPAIFVLEL